MSYKDYLHRRHLMIQKSMEELARRYEEGMKLDERLQKVSDEYESVLSSFITISSFKRDDKKPSRMDTGCRHLR